VERDFGADLAKIAFDGDFVEVCGGGRACLILPSLEIMMQLRGYLI
jgi:hypothetical protein